MGYTAMAAISGMAAFYFAMAAFYSAMAAFYITMAAFYINMAALLYIEHSRKLCSPKVSSSILLVTRTDPHIFPRCLHLTMVSVKDQPASMKNKLNNITTRKERCRFSKEETEGAVITNAPDKLVPLTMVLAIRDPSGFFAMVHTCAMMECWTLCRTLSLAKPCCTPVPCWNPYWTLSKPSHPAHYRQGPHRGVPPQPQLPPSQGALPLLPQQGGDIER